MARRSRATRRDKAAPAQPVFALADGFTAWPLLIGCHSLGSWPWAFIMMPRKLVADLSSDNVAPRRSNVGAAVAAVAAGCRVMPMQATGQAY